MLFYVENRYSKYPSTVPTKFTEFEVLNELKDCSSRTDSNCAKHTRFLFEMDDTPMEEQHRILQGLTHIVQRVTFSGKKSLHSIVELPDTDEDFARLHYKEIWAYLDTKYFQGKSDKACANPARLTRHPGGLRDRAVEQKLLYSSDNLLDLSSQDRRLIHSQYVSHHTVFPMGHRENRGRTHDGLCANYDVVTRYLSTRFPKLSGNGHSSSWLYAAVKCCQRYSDNATLDRVLDKAREEHWTEQELNRILNKENRK